MTAWTSTSTITLAAESDVGAPLKINARAPMISPPICVIGNSVLAPSRMKRMNTQAKTFGRETAGNRTNQARPAPATAIPRSSTTPRTPHPAASNACKTGPAPAQKIRTVTAPTPAIQPILTAQLICALQLATSARSSSLSAAAAALRSPSEFSRASSIVAIARTPMPSPRRHCQPRSDFAPYGACHTPMTCKRPASAVTVRGHSARANVRAPRRR